MRGVIVEGIDCSGKSTLISLIKYAFKRHGGIDVRELEHLDCKSQYERYLSEYSSPSKVIFHRSHISEVVFSSFYSRITPFNESELSILEKIVRNDFIVIMAEVSYSLFKERINNSRGSQVIDINDYKKLTELFFLNTKQYKPIYYSSKSTEELEKMCDLVVKRYFNYQ